MTAAATIETADGRLVVLRAVEPSDGAGLHRLYAALSPEDRQLRFFSSHTLTVEDADAFARVAERGGFGVVAVEPSTGEIVGDGRCTSNDGVTDMAVAVRGDFQGTGVGRALRDALSAEARARGIEVLVADILCDNQRMRRTLQSLPHVIVDRPDEQVVRLAYRTDGGVPGWMADGRPRVLVESRAWMGTIDERNLRAAGVQVAVCPGADADRGRPCALVQHGSCPLVEGADAVVFSLPLDDLAGRDLLAAHCSRGDGKTFVRPWPRDIPVGPGVTVVDSAHALEQILDAAERGGWPA